MASTSTVKEIKFLCVARRSDKVILASHTHTSDKTYDYIEKVKQVMSSPGWATVTSSKLSLEDGGYLFFVLIDEPGRVFIAVTSRNYASRYVYSESNGARGILTVLQKEVVDRFADVSLTAGPNGLNGKVGGLLKSLCVEFNDLKAMDKIAGVQAKVDAVTGVMRENVNLAMKNNDRIDDIDTKASDLADSAQNFSKASSSLKNAERWKLIKCYLMIAVVVIAVLSAIIAYFVNANKNSK